MNIRDALFTFGLIKPPSVATPVVPEFDPTKLGPKEILHSWDAQARPQFGSLNKRMMRTVIAIGAVIGLLLILMQEIFVIFFVASVVFFVYVLSKAPTETVHYELSTHGVICGDVQYYWQELKQFFFVKRANLDILVLDTHKSLPKRLFITIASKDFDLIKDIVGQRLLFLEQEPKTVIDTTAESILKKFNFEDK